MGAMKGWAARLGLGLLALLVGALLVAWWLHTYQLVDRTRTLPPAGEAAYNPLYALRLALQADGVAAVSRQRLQLDAVPLAPRDTVLLLGDPGLLSAREVDALLDWTARGGHLLVTTPANWRRSSAQAAGRLLPRLGVATLPASRECMAFLVTGEEDHVEFCGATRFTFAGTDPRASWGDFRQGFVFARFASGDGLVDVLAAADFMRNQSLGDGPHTALTRQLLAPNYGEGTVHLVYAASMPPLWRLVLEHAWMVWLPWLLALLAFLWMRMQRLGPLLPSPADARRSLLEHVQASGQHLRRHGLSALLHGAVRDAFLARLRRRDPLAAALDGRAQAEAIAARTGLTADHIEHALRSPRPRDARDFRLRIARLIDMGKRL
jgi:hypothetical protein